MIGTGSLALRVSAAAITDFMDLIERIAFEMLTLTKVELEKLAEEMPVKDATGMAAEFVYAR